MASVTASVATGGYRPPLATGSYTATATGVNYGTSTSQPGDTDVFLYYFIVPYLDAHVLSIPSWRYAYIFWIIIGFITVVWSLGHQLKRSAGSNAVTALIRKLSVRRVAFGEAATKPVPRGSNKPTWFTLTYGQLAALLGLTAIVLASTFAGEDYLSPTTCTWGGTCSAQVFDQGPPRSTYTRRALKRDQIAGTGSTAGSYPFQVSLGASDDPPPPAPASLPVSGRVQFRKAPERVRSPDLSKRVPLEPRASALSLNPGGWAPFNDPLLAAPNFTIYRLMWTTSSRIGLIAYALLPLAVCLSLKMYPFAIFATPWLTGYGFDKTAVIHRWTGRLIWLLSTAHTVTFAIQLTWDYDPYGRKILLVVWEYYRFNWGVVAYIALTFMVALSFNPLRKRYYEFFYYSHCVLVVVFLLGCIVHYEPLWGWATLAIILWGSERASRFLVWLWINGFFSSNIGPWQFWSERKGRTAMQAWKRSSDHSQHSQYFGDDRYRRPEGTHNHLEDAALNGSRPVHFRRTESELHGSDSATLVGSVAPAKETPSHQRPDLHPYSYSQTPPVTPYQLEYQPNFTSGPAATIADRTDARGPPTRRLLDAHRRSLAQQIEEIPAGFALAQLLPGQTIRLTIRTARRVRWAAGQNILLNVPSVAWWQSHPFSIANADSKDGGRGEGSRVVLLLRCRRGFTRRLWNHVADERAALEERLGSVAAKRLSGVLLRTMIGHPMGSAVRNRWEWYSTAVIICGGSGVTFGLAVLEELCQRMQSAADPSGGTSKNRGRTTRVRFIWILREHAHLAWIAPALRRCMEIVSPSQLGVDLHVTGLPHASDSDVRRTAFKEFDGLEKGVLGTDSLSPPLLPFAQGRGRTDRLRSEEALNSSTADIIDAYRGDDSDPELTEFDGGEPTSTATDAMLSARVLQDAQARQTQAPLPSGISSLHHQGPYGFSPDLSTSAFTSFNDSTPALVPQARALGRPPNSHAQRERPDLRHATSEEVLDLDDTSVQDLAAVAELAKPGKPRLGDIISEEASRSYGETIVACSGPPTLNTLVRKLVAERIKLRGPGLDVYTEDFAY